MPTSFKYDSHVGTGFFEGTDINGYSTFSTSSNTSKTAGLWINYSIPERANGTYSININKLILTTSSGIPIIMDPIIKNVTVVKRVDKDYPNNFASDYDPSNWKGSDCGKYIEDDVSHLVDCTI